MTARRGSPGRAGEARTCRPARAGALVQHGVPCVAPERALGAAVVAVGAPRLTCRAARTANRRPGLQRRETPARPGVNGTVKYPSLELASGQTIQRGRNPRSPAFITSSPMRVQVSSSSFTAWALSRRCWAAEQHRAQLGFGQLQPLPARFGSGRTDDRGHRQLQRRVHDHRMPASPCLKIFRTTP